MPKSPRTQKDIAAVKSRILKAALDIIYNEGFARLSMRKIAGKTGMTAANLYNYYQNKDDIYLAVQTRGFSELGRRFREIYEEMAAGAAKIRELIRAYIDFGIANPDQYEIMFTRNTPKYADYVGTPLEPAARIEKQTALKVAEIAQQAISEAISGTEATQMDAGYRCIQMWTTLHGVVSLVNSRVLQEVSADTDAFIQTLANEMTACFENDQHRTKQASHHNTRYGGRK